MLSWKSAESIVRKVDRKRCRQSQSHRAWGGPFQPSGEVDSVWGRQKAKPARRSENTVRTEVMREDFQEAWPVREEGRIRQKPE